MSVVAVRTEHGHTLIGEYDELRAHLAALAGAGRLTADGLLASGRMPDGRCFARVRLLTARPRRRVRRGLVVAGVVVAAVLLAVVGWLAVLALAWLVAHLAQIVAVAVALAVALLVLGRAGVCPGIHCLGCKHR